jgi:hypothetical protein
MRITPKKSQKEPKKMSEDEQKLMIHLLTKQLVNHSRSLFSQIFNTGQTMEEVGMLVVNSIAGYLATMLFDLNHQCNGKANLNKTIDEMFANIKNSINNPEEYIHHEH